MSKLLRLHSGTKVGRIQLELHPTFWFRNGVKKNGVISEMQVGDIGAARKPTRHEIVELLPVTKIERIGDA